MTYWNKIGATPLDEKKLNQKYSFEWMTFWPEPQYKVNNPFNVENLDRTRNFQHLFKEFIIADGRQPPEFSFKIGANEGYIVSIIAYHPDTWNKTGEVAFKFLDSDSAMKMIKDLINPNLV